MDHLLRKRLAVFAEWYPDQPLAAGRDLAVMLPALQNFYHIPRMCAPRIERWEGNGDIKHVSISEDSFVFLEGDQLAMPHWLDVVVERFRETLHFFQLLAELVHLYELGFHGIGIGGISGVVSVRVIPAFGKTFTVAEISATKSASAFFFIPVTAHGTQVSSGLAPGMAIEE
ncbi:MAG: hypothetical protein M0Q93_00850 [Terrimicrobiaceae bacterium]|nr:hypothetical protein [Terrimicrobiaceae bacterium]